MREYSGFDAKVNGELIDDLRRTNKANTLYVTHYFFALNDGNDLIFYYNPQHYWDRCPVDQINKSAWDYLENEAAIFRNFDPDKESTNRGIYNKISHSAFFPETPKIGNHYSCLGNRIISHHRNYYFLGDYGGCLKLNTKELSESDLKNLLYWAVTTKTPNYIKEISDLQCFKIPLDKTKLQ